MPRVKNNLALRRYDVEELKHHDMLTVTERNLFQTFHNHRKYGVELKECLENYIANRVSMVHQLMNECPLEQYFPDSRFSTLDAKGVAYALGDVCKGRRKRKSTSVFLWVRLNVSLDGEHTHERWFPLLPKGVKANRLLKELKRCGRDPQNETPCNFRDSKQTGIGVPNSRSNAHSKLWMKHSARRGAADGRQTVRLKNDNAKQLLGTLVNIGHVGFVKVRPENDDEDDIVWTKRHNIDGDALAWDDVTVCVNDETNAGVVLRKFYQCMQKCGGPNAMISRQMTTNYVPRTAGVCNLRIENQPLDVLTSQLKNVDTRNKKLHRTLRGNKPRVVHNVARDDTDAFAAVKTANRQFLQVVELYKHMKDVIAKLRDKLYRAQKNSTNEDYKHTIQRALRGAYFAMFLLLAVQKLSRRNPPANQQKMVSLGRMYSSMRTLLAKEFQASRIGGILTLNAKENRHLRAFQVHERGVCDKAECIRRLKDGGVFERLVDKYVAASATARLIMEKESLRLKLNRAETILAGQREKHRGDDSWTAVPTGEMYGLHANDWSRVPRDLVLAYKIWTYSQRAWKDIHKDTLAPLQAIHERTWNPWAQFVKVNMTVQQWDRIGTSRAAKQSVEFEEKFNDVVASLAKVREYMNKFNSWSRNARHNPAATVEVSNVRNQRVEWARNVSRHSVLEDMRPGKIRSSLRRLQTICEVPPDKVDEELKEGNNEGGGDDDNDDGLDDYPDREGFGGDDDGGDDDGGDDDGGDDDNYNASNGPANNAINGPPNKGGLNRPLTRDEQAAARTAARRAAMAILPRSVSGFSDNNRDAAPAVNNDRRRATSASTPPSISSMSHSRKTEEEDDDGIYVNDDDLNILDNLDAGGNNPLQDDEYDFMFNNVDDNSSSDDS